jgi:hypothetical protein
LARETEVLEENLPSACLSTTNSTCPGAKPGRRGGEPATNRLSCGTAKLPWKLIDYCSVAYLVANYSNEGMYALRDGCSLITPYASERLQPPTILK